MAAGEKWEIGFSILRRDLAKKAPPPVERRAGADRSREAVAKELWPPGLYPDTHISSLGLEGDAEARRLLRMALRDAWPAAKRFGWHVGNICELEPSESEVGYAGEDGTVFVKVRDPNKVRGRFYSYSFVLATLLHELTHFTVLGHGKAFYKRLAEAIAVCGADPAVRREARGHVCAELLNAVCENDGRRARALIGVLPEAVSCRLPGAGHQLPLEYAAHHGRVAITRLLLEARADPDCCASCASMPPLARAAARGNAKTAKLLLEAGAMRGREVLERLGSAPRSSAEGAATAEDVWAEGARSRPTSGRRRSESLPALGAARREDAARLRRGR